VVRVVAAVEATRVAAKEDLVVAPVNILKL
jgi:hypothetical protein